TQDPLTLGREPYGRGDDRRPPSRWRGRWRGGDVATPADRMAHASPPAASREGRPGMRRRALPVIYLAVFVDMLGFGIILPLLPFHAEQLGGTGLWVGGVLTAYAAAQFV